MQHAEILIPKNLIYIFLQTFYDHVLLLVLYINTYILYLRVFCGKDAPNGNPRSQDTPVSVSFIKN